MSKKYLLKRTLCISLVCSLLVGITLFNVNGITESSSISKIDYGLQTLLDKSNNDDKISVSVWFTDVDHNDVKSKVMNYLKKDIASGVVSKKR